MNDKKVALSERTARAMFHDVALSNLMFCVFAVWTSLNAPLWLVIILWLWAASSFLHIFQAKKILVKGKLFRWPFKKKVKKDDGSKRS